MSYIGLGRGEDACVVLLSAIEGFEHWAGDDPAYSKARHLLDRVERELDVLTASPGHRAALRSMGPVHSGQDMEMNETFG